LYVLLSYDVFLSCICNYYSTKCYFTIVSKLTHNYWCKFELHEYCLVVTLKSRWIVVERLRDTLVHELCHAIVWIEHKVIDGHGRFWKHWYSSTVVNIFGFLSKQNWELQELYFLRARYLSVCRATDSVKRLKVTIA